MENAHNNVEFGVLQKTSKQSLISIFFYIGRGNTPSHSPLLTQTRPPTHHFLDPPLVIMASGYILSSWLQGICAIKNLDIGPRHFQNPGSAPVYLHIYWCSITFILTQCDRNSNEHAHNNDDSNIAVYH